MDFIEQVSNVLVVLEEIRTGSWCRNGALGELRYNKLSSLPTAAPMQCFGKIQYEPTVAPSNRIYDGAIRVSYNIQRYVTF